MDLATIVESGPPELLATGFTFTEGPLWHPEGYWLFVDFRHSLIYKLAPGGGAEIYRQDSGGSNGITFDLEGRLILCEGYNRQVARKEHDGTYISIAGYLDGKRLNRPNDVICRSDGSIYFTDPAGVIPEADRELGYSGVHRIAPDGSLDTVNRGIEFPNGLCFSPDEQVLYVAISWLDERCVEAKKRGEICRHQLIRAFDVAHDGTLSNDRVFAEMFSAEDGIPDGMKVDVEGRVYCTGPGGCWIFNSSGNYLGIVRLPEIPANCAWGSADNRTMLFTAHSSVYSMRMKTPGTKIHRS